MKRYTGEKRKEYEAAKLQYDLGLYKGKFDDYIPKMSNFSKTNEKIYIDYTSNNPKVKSRNITEQHPMIKVLLGPLIEYVSHCLKIYDEAYGSGLSMQERAEKFERWIKHIPDYVVICIDGSAFDSTQFMSILRVTDEALYLKIILDQAPYIANYCNIEDLRKIVKNHMQKVKSRYCSYKIKGTIPSGSMKTSQSNTSRSSAYARYILEMIGAIETVDFFLETCGDDTIIILRKMWVDAFKDGAYKFVYSSTMDKKKHALGQIAKMIEIFPSLTGLNEHGKQAEYLSCYFLQNKYGQIKMIRKLDRLLQLNPWTQSNQKNKLSDEYELNKQLAKGDGMEILSWCGDIEFLTHYALMLIRLAGNVVEKYEWHHQFSIRLDKRSHLFNDAFLEHVKNLWGITEWDICTVIKSMIRNTELYGKIETSIIDKLWPTDFHKLKQTIDFLNRKRRIPQLSIMKKKKCRSKVEVRPSNSEYFSNEIWMNDRVFDI